MPERRRIVIDEKLAGERLDRIIRNILPNAGLRQCRRLIEEGFACLNACRTHPGARPVKGDLLEITTPKAAADFPQPFEIGRSGPFSFFFKPRGLHSAAIAGNFRPSLEHWLNGKGKLLQRLDFNTCGIVCAASDEAAAREFRLQEAKGACRKWYLCLLSGKMREPQKCAAPLDTDGRVRTKILKGEGNALNETIFLPLPELEMTQNISGAWALAGILRGQRHQIRAHAAALGHALLNDDLYGKGNGDFYLRHFFLEFPGHCCFHLEDAPGGFPLPAPAKTLRALIREKLAEAGKWK